MQQLSCVCTVTGSGAPRQPEGSGGARQGSSRQRTPVDQQDLQQAAPEGMDLQAIDGEADSHRQYKGNRRRSLMSLGLSFQMALSVVLTQSIKWSDQQLSLRASWRWLRAIIRSVTLPSHTLYMIYMPMASCPNLCNLHFRSGHL